MITIKKFATKTLTGGSATAEGFISQHREFLNAQEVVRPLLVSYDQKQVPADITLCQLQSALMSHMLQMNIAAAQAKMDKQRASASAKKVAHAIQSKKVNDRYSIHLFVMQYDKQQQMTVVHLPADEWTENEFGSAQRLADRRLYQRHDSLYATITNTQGNPIETHVQRQDAMYRMLRQRKGPFQKRTGSASSSLKWIGKAKQDHCSFSRG